MDNKIDYSVRKGIRPKPKCEDYELCACDADGASHTLKVSFNESDQIVDAVIERVNNNVQLEWRGPEDGLPPVGTVCECSLDFEMPRCDSNWNLIEVLYCDESTVVGRIIKGLHSPYYSNGFETTLYNFRPIRSEEDKAVEEMMKFAPVDNGSMAGIACQHMARQLYRAEYRKQEDE